MNAMDIFTKMRDKFHDKVMPNNRLPKSILNSEGFAFCALADYYGADLIIESGICNGGSTIILCKYFNDIPILSIDISIKMEVIIRTSIYHNVTLISGDSNVLLPQAVKVFKDKKIAILIDGPKGINAITLAGKCFSNKSVIMVGIHDLYRGLYGKPKNDRIIFDNLKVNKFITDNDEFVEKFGYLNGDCEAPKNEKYCSTQYKGYGPTIGFLMKGVV